MNGYFGHWYISHCLWSSPQTTKGSLAALRKLADLFLALGMIDETCMEEFKETVKECKEEWIEDVDMSSDPDAFGLFY